MFSSSNEKNNKCRLQLGLGRSWQNVLEAPGKTVSVPSHFCQLQHPLTSGLATPFADSRGTWASLTFLPSSWKSVWSQGYPQRVQATPTNTNPLIAPAKALAMYILPSEVLGTGHEHLWE